MVSTAHPDYTAPHRTASHRAAPPAPAGTWPPGGDVDAGWRERAYADAMMRSFLARIRAFFGPWHAPHQRFLDADPHLTIDLR